jgi:DNA-binding transcriptional MerR regulator
VGERSYLAIGDVLALLREEFPDVTISKIRFLESRGLLVPERTPSGYRKFYEQDVERLRWILRQQREHFLPLKVIKGRLDNGMSDPEAPTPHLFEMGDPPPDREAEAVLVGVPGTAETVRERSRAEVGAMTPVAMAAASSGGIPGRTNAPVLAGRETVPSGGHASPTGPTGPSEGGVPPARPSSAGRTSNEPERGSVASTGRSGGRRTKGHATPPGTTSRETTQDTGPGTDGQQNEERDDTAEASRRALSRSTAGLPGAGLSGASLTLAELANASGLEVSGIEELESFGLIAGRTVAGVHCYDEEAVLVAKLAAGFAPYGIGARHLRIFKHAADRQTGLFAQVVTPLLRQRNPAARARAIEDVSELADLGEALMRCFSQAALRELTGG